MLLSVPSFAALEPALAQSSLSIEEIEAKSRERILEATARSKDTIKTALEILANNPPGSAATAAAAESLRSLGGVALGPLLGALRDVNVNLSQGARITLSRIIESPPADVDASALQAQLLKLLNSDEKLEARRLALEVLASAADPRLISAIEPLLHSPDKELRARSVAILGRMKTASLVPAIVQALKDETFEVRRAAVVALTEIRDPSTLAAILPRLDDQSYDVREQSYRAIATFGDASALPILVSRLDRLAQSITEMAKDDSIVRREAKWCLEAIGSIGSWHALPTLRAQAVISKGEHRALLDGAILKILARVRAEKDRSAMDELLALLDLPDSKVVQAAYAAVGALQDDRALPKLYEKMDGPERPAVLLAIRAVGEIGEPKSGPRLKRKVRDRNPEVVRAAAKALALIGDRSELDKLTGDWERALKDDPKDFRANRSLADVYKEVRLWKRATTHYKAALASAPDGVTRGEMQLKLAQCYSLLNDLDDAFKAAQKAIAEGFVDAKALEKDPDLDALRKSARWKELVPGGKQ